MITHDELVRVLDYDLLSGIWTWRVDCGRWGRIKAGSIAGSLNGLGYLQIKVQGKVYLAHQLAVFYVEGSWPDYEIDHVDVSPTNCAWNNLRKATHSQNMANRRITKRNSSGTVGVAWDQDRKRWTARIGCNGKQITIGRFKNFEDAKLARDARAAEVFGEFYCQSSLGQDKNHGRRECEGYRGHRSRTRARRV